VSRALTTLGVPHEVEKLTDNGYFRIDIYLESPRGPVALEVDGPSHFTVNTLRPLGAAVLRFSPGALHDLLSLDPNESA
jgi:hypothetical protein